MGHGLVGSFAQSLPEIHQSIGLAVISCNVCVSQAHLVFGKIISLQLEE